MNIIQAVLLIVVAAVMNATYTLAMKSHREWRWEHSWCAFSILGVAVVPTVIAVLSIPHLFSIYEDIPISTLAMMMFFGAAWGVSQVFFGLSLPLVGIAVAFTISLSTSAASGSLLPLITRHPDRLFTSQGLVLLVGIFLIAVGVALCARAGMERERLAGKVEKLQSSGFVKGFLFSVISGVLGSLLNLGLAYGDPIQKAAQDRGASEVMTSNAVWLPCVYAGFIPGVVYCVYLMRKNGAVSDFFGKARWFYWPGAALMGLLWYGSIVVYAVAASKLGEIGTTIGWPLFLSAIVVMSNVVGVATREWRMSARGPFRTLVAGLCCLLVAIVVVSEAGRLTG